MKDFYYILGVDHNCSFNDIQSAYNKLSGKFNPDLNNGDRFFKSRFQELNEAYETLGNPYNRKQYDQQLNAFYNGQDQILISPPVPRRSRIGVGMTVILILLAFIIGDYIFQYFKKPAARKINESYVENLQPDTVVITHKRHHLSKIRLTNDSITRYHKFYSNLSQKNLAKVAGAKPVKQKYLVASKVVPFKHASLKSSKDSSKGQAEGRDNNGVLYTTYISPNATGVVNLRSQDAYSSPIFATIPANSKVSVLERGDTYYKVSFFNYTGYVPKWSLQIK